MTIDQWQAIGIVCGSLIAFITLIGLLRRKVLQPMWRSMKLAARLLEQLTGDPEGGVPSLMDRLAQLDANQTAVQVKLDEHLRWHASPGGGPAKASPAQPNGGAATRRRHL